jgi:exopolysaccharide production protein ExoQ
MSAPDIPDPRQETVAKHPLWVLAAVYALFGPVAAFAKMGTVPLLIFSLFAQTSVRSLIENLKQSMCSPIAFSIWILMTWCVVSFLWSDSVQALSLLRLILLILAAFLFVHTIRQIAVCDKKLLARILTGAVTFLLLVLLFEGATDALLHRIVRPEDAAPRDGEWVPYLQMVAARGTAFLAPFCFIVAVLLKQISKRKWLGVVFVALSLLAANRLPMDASALAIAIGCIAYALAWWKPHIMARLTFISLALFALSAPVLMTSVLTTENFEENGINPPRAVEQRFEIWQYTSELILERPILGYGFDASREIGTEGVIIAGTNWAALPLHPHNAVLQIWLELGLIGVFAFLYTLWQLWRLFETQVENGTEIATFMAVLCAITTISFVSFGVWQYWWIATWALIGGALQLIELEPAETGNISVMQ